MLSMSHRSVAEVEMFDIGTTVYFSAYGGKFDLMFY